MVGCYKGLDCVEYSASCSHGTGQKWIMGWKDFFPMLASIVHKIKGCMKTAWLAYTQGLNTPGLGMFNGSYRAVASGIIQITPAVFNTGPPLHIGCFSFY
jgi:hypothetical protein